MKLTEKNYLCLIPRREMTFYLGLIICFFILTNCKKKESIIEKVDLKEEMGIAQFSDSSFFSDIRSICFSDNHYYISDYNRDQIFVTTKDFKLCKIIGNKGQGPGEFTGAAQLYLNEDVILAVNDGKRSVEMFNGQKYIGTIPLPDKSFTGLTRFFEKNGYIYFSCSSVTHSISKYNYTSKKTYSFGQVKKYSTDRETLLKNDRHLLLYKNMILAIPDCQSIIELYNLDGKLLSTFDFSDIDPVNNTLKFVESKKQTENSYCVTNVDVSICKSKLFILILTVDKKSNTQSNTILEFEIDGTKIIPSKILNLGKGWFETFCVSEQGIVTFNTQNNRLIRYRYEAE